MYQQLSKMLPEEKIEAITKSLVALNSINGTLGEGKKADYIKDMIKSFPYFQENP